MEKHIKVIKIKDTYNKFEIFKIAPGTISGVNIPALLALPRYLKGKNKITLVFNNENGLTLNESLENILMDLPYLIEKMNFDSPILIPILPSQQEFNQSLKKEGINLWVGESKQFARECFLPEISYQNKFYRLDNQVSTLIKYIIENDGFKFLIQNQRVSNQEKLVFCDKLNGFGHSGAGAAMLRFALLHPEILDRLIIGGNGDIIPTPFGEHAQKLEYPFGIKDYEKLFGREFLAKEYKKINFQFYIGDREDTNPVFDTIRDENYVEGKTGKNFAPKELATIYKDLYGTQFFLRLRNVLGQYEKNGYNVGLKIYENDCHSVIQPIDLQGILDGTKFFNSDCSRQLEQLLEKTNKNHI